MKDLLEQIEINVRFTGVSVWGNIFAKTIKLIVPNFKELNYNFGGFRFYESPEEQLDFYIMEKNKKKMMVDHEFLVINSWTIPEPKRKPLDKRQLIYDLFISIDASKQFRNDFFSIYDTISHKIKHKSVVKQFDHVIDIIRYTTPYVSSKMAEFFHSAKKIKLILSTPRTLNDNPNSIIGTSQ